MNYQPTSDGIALNCIAHPQRGTLWNRIKYWIPFFGRPRMNKSNLEQVLTPWRYIIVNGRECRTSKRSLTYEEICTMADQNPLFRPSVTWHKKGTNEGGSLRKGEVYAFGFADKRVVIFNCHITNNA